MKLLLAAATALTMTGAALAHPDHQHMTAAPVTGTAIEPNVLIRPPAGWSEPQLVLFREHMTYFPETWTVEQRAAYLEQLGASPIQWTPEQRMLYYEHIANLPPTWTAEQRTMYEQQIASMPAPWEQAGMGGPEETVEDEAMLGTTQNDLVDTRGAAIIRDNQRGIDADDVNAIEDDDD